MTNNELKEKSRGTVANILYYYYSSGVEVPKEIMKSIDFKEGVKKEFTLGQGTDRLYQINESNILNCVLTLPFKSYEKYMDITWILNKEIESSRILIGHALYFGLTEVLDKSFEIVKNYIKSKNIYEFMGRNDLMDYFFSPVLNISKNLSDLTNQNVSINEIQWYYKFYKNTLSLFKELEEKKAEHFKIPKEKDIDNWHKNGQKIAEMLYSYSNEKELNNVLVSNKKCLGIFKEVLDQYRGDENPENPFFDSVYIRVAMIANNMDAIDCLVDRGIIQIQDVVFEYNDLLRSDLFEFIMKFTASPRKEFKCTVDERVKMMDEFLKKYDVEINYRSDPFLYLLLGDSEECKVEINRVIKNFDGVKIFAGLSLDDLADLSECIAEFLEELNIKVDEGKYEQDFDLYLFRKIKEKKFELKNHLMNDDMRIFLKSKRNTIKALNNVSEDEIDIIVNKMNNRKIINQSIGNTKKDAPSIKRNKI